MTHPTISVIIPCYNREDILPRAIGSVLNQSVAVHEIIVVDDGSSDRSAHVARQFGGLVKVLEQPNSGAAAARNLGIRHAEGDWIAFLDSDDKWVADKLEKQIQCSKRYPEAKLIFCDTQTIDDEGVAMPSRFALGGVHENADQVEREFILLRSDLFRTLLTQSRVITSAVMVCNGLANLEFAEDIWGSEDWYLWMELSKDYRFAAVDEILVTMYQQGDNISGKKGKLFRNNIEVLNRLEKNEPEDSEVCGYIKDLRKRIGIGAIYYSILAGEFTDAKTLIKSGDHSLNWYKQMQYQLGLLAFPNLLRRLMLSRKQPVRW